MGTSCVIAVGGEAMWRSLLFFACALRSDGWFWANETSTPDKGPWREWLDSSSPTIARALETVEERAAQARDWAGDLNGVSDGWSFGLILDAILGFFGWAIFGSAWDGVKSGCRRLLQLGAVLVVCLFAHYAWAVAWPVVSLVTALAMAIVCVVRAGIRFLGTCGVAIQRACGGAPEAYGAEYYGPATGRIPETAELRRFKKVDADQWYVLRKEGKAVVFRPSGDATSIKASGLYVAVDYDTVRGDNALVKELRGVDKVHLCRNTVCPEEGHHFQEYGIVKKVDAEKIQLAQATEGAAQACTTMFRWFRGGVGSVAAVAKDYASESETEQPNCVAHKICWMEEDGVVELAARPCTGVGSTTVDLLVDDQTGSAVASLCPVHASCYMQKRYTNKCSYKGCNRVGLSSDGGMQCCAAHRTSSRSRSSSRARGKERGEDRAQREVVINEAPEEDVEIRSELKDVKRLLQEIQVAGKAVNTGEDDEENGEPPKRRTRLNSRSPGRTPKSSIHRNLAKVGLLDSPGDERTSLLEEFFDRFAEARPLGVSEDEIRSQLANKHDMSMEAVARRLHELGTFEQGKGQRGLSKFLVKWKEAAETSPESEGQTSSWSVIPEGQVGVPSQRSRMSSASASPSVPPPPGIPGSWEQRTVGLVRPPATYGNNDRKAGAVSTDGSGTQSMARIAEAIQHQTAELANLVRSQVDVNSHPAGTVKGLAKQSEELVFLMRACGQYDVKLCPNEYGQSLAQGLLSAQHGAATKLRNLGCRQKMTTRLAIGLAGPYWGTHEKFTLGVSDFVAYTDAELDSYAWESGKSKGTVDTRPALPTRLEEWESRVRRHIDIWRLTYGEEWRTVKTKAAKLLATWHSSAPHQWPLTVLMDCWEELHWRFTEELKEVLRSLKREAGRETMTLNEVKFHALMPDASGYAWLQLPSTFDLEDPNSWFATEVKPRIERKQDRALWKLTWESRRSAGRSQRGGTDRTRGKTHVEDFVGTQAHAGGSYTST